MAAVFIRRVMDRREAQLMAESLMEKHGLRDWSFQWIGTCHVVGRCLPRSKIIQLSLPFVRIADAVHVKDVILHEIAHALTPGGHSPAWKETAEGIGARPERFAGVRVRRNLRIAPSRLPDARQEWLDFGE